jgi:glycosyltransferase involved in cell wall biosynthesis
MKVKLGYFTHSNFAPSETFIYDLVKSLNSEEDIDLTYITGKKVPLKTDFEVKSITTGYSEKYLNWTFIIYKIGQMFGKGYQMKMQFQKLVAFRSIKNSKLPQFDIAYVDYATSAVLLMDYFEVNKIPFIVHVHGYDITSCLKDTAYIKEVKKLFKKATAFIVASHYMKRRLILLGCEEKKINVIRLGVEYKSIVPKSWTDRKKQVPSIIFLGRLTEKKHPVALLYAFKIVKEKIPEAQLSIIGDGPLKNEVQQIIKDLGLIQSVKMYGVLNRTESFPILNNHWLYVQHSVTAISGDTEGFAISLAEAALHELPVVSTIHNGIVENVIDGKTGFLVPEYDYETMAEKIIYLIQHPDIAEQMGKAGREHIMKLCEPGKRIKEIKYLLIDKYSSNKTMN